MELLKANLAYVSEIIRRVGKADPALVDRIEREYAAEVDAEKELTKVTQISGDNAISWDHRG